MVKNLLRNGGFERGDTQFWDAFDNSAFVVDTGEKYKGTYSGKLTASVGDNPYIMCSDYLSIQEGETFVFRMAAKAQTAYTLRPQVVYFDEDLTEISSELLIGFPLSISEWRDYMDLIYCKEGARYFKIKLKQLQSGVDKHTFMDYFSIYQIERARLISDIKLLQDESQTDAIQTYTGDDFAVPHFKEAVFLLDVIAKANETGTLDVVVYTFDRSTDNWTAIASFNQVTTTLGEQVLVVTAGLGNFIQARGAVAGTNTPGFTWKVSGIFKP